MINNTGRVILENEVLSGNLKEKQTEIDFLKEQVI